MQANRLAIKLLKATEATPSLALLGRVNVADLLGSHAVSALLDHGVDFSKLRAVSIQDALRGFHVELEHRLKTKGHRAQEPRLHMALRVLAADPDVTASEMLEIALRVGAEAPLTGDERARGTQRAELLEQWKKRRSRALLSGTKAPDRAESR